MRSSLRRPRRKKEGDPRRRPEPTTGLARRQNAENCCISTMISRFRRRPRRRPTTGRRMATRRSPLDAGSRTPSPNRAAAEAAAGWGCGNGGNPCPKPKTRKQRKTRIAHRLSTLSAQPRTKNSRTTRKDKNPERRLSSSLEADESDPAQPRRCKTRTNPQRPAPAAIPPESRRP